MRYRPTSFTILIYFSFTVYVFEVSNKYSIILSNNTRFTLESFLNGLDLTRLTQPMRIIGLLISLNLLEVIDLIYK